MVGFREFGEQPVHFVLLKWHIDLDRGMARDGRRNAPANLFQVQRLLLPLNLVEQLVQHVLNLRRVHSGRRNFHRNAARAKRLSFEAVVL